VAKWLSAVARIHLIVEGDIDGIQGNIAVRLLRHFISPEPDRRCPFNLSSRYPCCALSFRVRVSSRQHRGRGAENAKMEALTFNVSPRRQRPMAAARRYCNPVMDADFT
jgi:hypothetical protein